MKVRSIDTGGDWTFGRGINDYKSDFFAVVQNVRTRLNMLLGDCFFAANEGIDWLNLNGQKDQLAVSIAVSKTILETEGITGLVQLSIALSPQRKLEIRYRANTVFSLTAFDTFVRE